MNTILEISKESTKSVGTQKYICIYLHENIHHTQVSEKDTIFIQGENRKI